MQDFRAGVQVAATGLQGLYGQENKCMSMFTTRVELHQATWDDYVKLHAAMESAGFSRFVTADNGTKWQLPTAEYNLVGTYTVQQVLGIASNAARTVGKRFAVFVSEATARWWDGLARVS